MKKILKMPLRRIPRRPPPAESLRAKAAAEAETYEDEDYEAEEPNMKFSHALIVVLALHIIAVGGVFAFNSIKAGHSPSSKLQTKDENSPSAAQAAAEPKPSPARQAPEARAGKTLHRAKPATPLAASRHFTRSPSRPSRKRTGSRPTP